MRKREWPKSLLYSSLGDAYTVNSVCALNKKRWCIARSHRVSIAAMTRIIHPGRACQAGQCSVAPHSNLDTTVARSDFILMGHDGLPLHITVVAPTDNDTIYGETIARAYPRVPSKWGDMWGGLPLHVACQSYEW